MSGKRSIMQPSSCRIKLSLLILMRWLLDQGLPRSAASELNRSGHDAVHVSDIQMAQSADSQILACGLVEKRIVVTLDADFHALLAISGADKPSVIRIREEGLKAPALAALLIRIAAQFASELESGCMMSFSNEKIRTRALPLQS